MSGNVWEWTLTVHGTGRMDDITYVKSRAVRGGSWSSTQDVARAAYRDGISQDNRT